MFGQSSFPWLLAREAKILWRNSILVRSRRYVLLPVLLVCIAFQGVALILGRFIIWHSPPQRELILVMNINLFFFGFLMLSRAITAAVDVLYARGDVDFLLASPIPPGRVLAVRMLGVGLSVAAPWLLLGGALANALLAYGQVWALALYPMLFAVGQLAAAAAFALVVGLTRLMAPGTARALGHVMALATGLVIFALGQAPRFIAPARMRLLWRALMPDGDAGGLRWLPGQAMLGQPLALLFCLAVALAAFLAVWLALAEPFASGAVSAAAYRPAGVAGLQRGRFRKGAFSAAFAKNKRLIARFPGLATQVMYRSLSLVPVAMILAGGVKIGTGPQVVAPLLVFLAGQLALFFISVLMVTDQALELADTAPAPPETLRSAALGAAGYAALLIMALPAALALLRQPDLARPLCLGLAGVLLTNLILGQKLPIPLVRADFGKTQKATVFGLIIGVSVSSFWAWLVWLSVMPQPLGALVAMAR